MPLRPTVHNEKKNHNSAFVTGEGLAQRINRSSELGTSERNYSYKSNFVDIIDVKWRVFH